MCLMKSGVPRRNDDVVIGIMEFPQNWGLFWNPFSEEIHCPKTFVPKKSDPRKGSAQSLRKDVRHAQSSNTGQVRCGGMPRGKLAETLAESLAEKLGETFEVKNSI